MLLLATSHQNGDARFPLLLLPLFAAILIVHLVWRSTRKQRVLDQWSAQQEFKLIRCDERWLARGPFFFSAGKGQVIYRITALYPDGRIRTGWLKCGSFFLGLLSDDVEVRWDKEKREAPGFPVIVTENQEKRPPS